MFLDKITLEEDLLTNKYAVAIVGKLKDTDRIILKKGLDIYNDSKEYVGECHIERMYFTDVSKGVRSMFNIEHSSFVLFFKNGFLVNTIGGPGTWFTSSTDLYEIIIQDMGINLV